ncbi:hypothetical protein PRIC1_013128 [Phytophthora ramorum]
METYISSKEYGTDVDHPKIYAAIAFQNFPQDTSAFGDLNGYPIEYSLRFNSTGSLSSVPKTKKPRPSQQLNFAPAEGTMAYTTRGFMTLQTLIARFLNCMPTWNVQVGSIDGTCQVHQAVMPADTENDRRLLLQVENDMLIGTAFTLLNTVKDLITEMASVSLPNVSVDTIPALSVETLLVPLRIAPQSFHGAAVYGSPTQAFRYAPFFGKVALVFPIGFVLSYLYLVSRVIVSFLMEKETRSRELMCILGAQNGELLAGWVLAYVPILLLGAILQTLGAHGLLFPKSDVKLLFIFFFTFATSSFSYGFMISTLFSRARAGSLAGMGLFFMMFFISYSFNNDSSESARTLAGLLPPISLSQGVSVIAKLESYDVGVTNENANEEVNNFRFANAVGMQILDTLLYFLLGKYFEKVVPQEFGVAEKWYFFFTKVYWFPQASKLVSAETLPDEELGDISKEGDTVEASSGALGTTVTLHSESVTLLVQQHVAQALVASDIGTEFTFQLPFEASASFPALFRELEARQSDLGIISFAISVTTLEEIFLKVAEGSSSAVTTEGDGSPNMTPWEAAVGVEFMYNTKGAPEYGTSGSKVMRVTRVSPVKAFLNQMTALLRKRVQCGKRDFNMLFFSTILPIVAIFIGLSALKFSTVLVNDPKLELSPSVQYLLAKHTPVPFSCPSNLGNSTAWCSELVEPAYFSDGTAYEIEIDPTVYNALTTPTVFGITYDSPPIDPSDTSGYSLRFAELVFEKGYGYTSNSDLAGPPAEAAVGGQFGGYLLYASETTNTLSYNILANSSSTHAAPTYKHMMDSTIHRFLLSKALGVHEPGPNMTVRVSSHPLPLSFRTRSIFSSYLSFPAVIFIVIAFTFIPASIMPYIVKEKQLEQNAKYQQLLSGMSFFAYWLANFIFDVVLYLVPMAAAILLLRSYGVTSSLSGETCDTCTQDVPAAMVTLFVLFGTAIAPWTYLLSHVMEKPSECLLYTVMINFFLGLLLLLLSFTMNSLDSTQAANEI